MARQMAESTAAYRNEVRQVMREIRELASKVGKPGMVMPHEAAARMASDIRRAAAQWGSSAGRRGFMAEMEGAVSMETPPHGDMEGKPAQFYAELARLLEEGGR